MMADVRPEGTEGMTEAHLTACVTRDGLIGVAMPHSPTSPVSRELNENVPPTITAAGVAWPVASATSVNTWA